MSKKMLIDASHPEETRVVIVNGTRVEELDFESRNKRQLRGNVYLARVTRVEPSLQAAFVEYGGNRHGFLAFSEIHPDYYQIPYEDRMALLEDEESHHEDESDDDSDEADEHVDPDEDDVKDEADEEVAEEQVQVASKRRKRTSRRRYKIQEVIKRGQILLIQAVKEERGNKGAAMTTYLSLAGRYCVLMPNTPRGGGISRKIANGSDRKRLKSIMSELEVPQGMGVIVRTAGGKRTKVEIKRDYDYLSRLWETIRETTLKSIAPALIHEEGNLVKRSIRDMYNKDIDEVLVQGDEAYKTAKDFIKMLMPSHAKNVKAYKDPIPLYLRYEVEKQIESSLDSVVQLKSGGYLVIHPTEALVSVDVNSGRSTRERNIERTALKTNLEAAEEVARQMRLRDLAGLVVIDFIDMDEHRNNRAVEKRMKDCLAQDRARVQTDKISQFGLMEISRQRRRRSLLEGSTASCEHCEGVGRKRTIESSALVAIRAVEEIGARRQMKRIRLKVSPDVAIYIFNEKRDLLQHVDDTFDMFTELVGDDTLIRPAFQVESLENRDKEEDPLNSIEEQNKRDAKQQARNPQPRPKQEEEEEDDDVEENDTDTSADAETSGQASESVETEDANSEPRKRRRRRGRRGGRGKRPNETSQESENETSDSEDSEKDAESVKSDTPRVTEEKAAEPQSKSRRGRGRRKAPGRQSETSSEAKSEDAAVVAKTDESSKTAEAESKPKLTGRRKAPSKTKASDTVETISESETPEPSDTPAAADSETSADKAAAPKRRRRAPTKKKADSTTLDKAAPSSDEKGRTEEKPVASKKAAPAKSASRRKAPEKTNTSKGEGADPSAPKKRAPRKKPVPKAVVTEEVIKLESSAPARRAAPSRKSAAAETSETAKTAAKKAPAIKRAPSKKVAKTAESSTATPEPAKKAAPKTRARRKAPSRPPSPVSEAKADPEPVSASKDVSSQAPKTDAKVTPQSLENKTPQTAVKPAFTAPQPKVESEPKAKKKRGWLSRLTKGE